RCLRSRSYAQQRQVTLLFWSPGTKSSSGRWTLWMIGFHLFQFVSLILRQHLIVNLIESGGVRSHQFRLRVSQRDGGSFVCSSIECRCGFKLAKGFTLRLQLIVQIGRRLVFLLEDRLYLLLLCVGQIQFPEWQTGPSRTGAKARHSTRILRHYKCVSENGYQ